MDRREFLRTVATSGYAVGVAHLLGVEDFLGVDDGEVPIVTALVRDDPTIRLRSGSEPVPFRPSGTPPSRKRSNSTSYWPGSDLPGISAAPSSR